MIHAYLDIQNWALFKILCCPFPLRTVSGWHQPKWASHRFQWDEKDDQKVCGVMSGSYIDWLTVVPIADYNYPNAVVG